MDCFIFLDSFTAEDIEQYMSSNLSSGSTFHHGNGIRIT